MPLSKPGVAAPKVSPVIVAVYVPAAREPPLIANELEEREIEVYPGIPDTARLLGEEPPQALGAFGTKKFGGKLMLIEPEVPEVTIAVAVVNVNVAVCCVFDAMRLAQGMTMDTPVTWPPLGWPIMPVCAKTVV